METKEIKVYARESLLIQSNQLSERLTERLKDKYKLMFYEEKACADCEWLPDRHCSTCDNCAAFKGGVELAKNVVINEKTYLSLPIGDKQGVEEVLKRFAVKYVSKHKKVPFSKTIKFTGTLKPFQREAVDAIKSKKRGVIKAPPRSGKTVLAAAAACELGGKTIILAAQREWLDGFYETFCGSDTQKPLTNASPKKVGFAKTLADFERLDVCLVTYQTFRSDKGKRLLRKIRDFFEVLIVDEVHMGAATNFASVISRLNTAYKIGLSGTPNRKDQRYVIVRKLIGVNIYVAKVDRLRPTIRLVRTAYKKTYKANVLWTTMVAGLEKDPARLKLIAKHAIQDAKNGHMVLIPLSQVVPIKALVMTINRMSGRTLAHEFHGSVKTAIRKSLIKNARKYKVKILVGNTKLLSTGINIPRASAVYEVAMSSNKENCEQRIARILTPWEDKPPPMVRIFLDDMNVRRRCLNNEWWQCIKPIFKPIISEKDDRVLKGYLAQKEKTFAAWEM
jgi:superfamily II DNA or RNA helicase